MIPFVFMVVVAGAAPAAADPVTAKCAATPFTLKKVAQAQPAPKPEVAKKPVVAKTVAAPKPKPKPLSDCKTPVGKR